MSHVKVGPGKYRIFISDGTNLDGSRRRYSKTVTTDLTGRDLKRFLMEAEFDFEDEIKKRDPQFSKLAKGTFEEYSIWWLEYKDISEKTRDGYQSLLDTRILPYMGNNILEKLTHANMLEVMKKIKTIPAKKTGKILSTSSIKSYHTLLKNMINDAVRLKIITENIMEEVPVQTPRAQLKDNYYDIEDINKLLDLLPKEPIRYQLATILALTTGARLGEIAGLQWKHFDIDNCIVTIEQTNSYENKKTVIKKEEYTKTSLRKVVFPKSLLKIIERHREDEILKKEAVGNDWYYGYDTDHENDFVFTQRNGKVIFINTISSWFRKFRRNHKLKDITFHGLRHTSTTILISSGINVRNISSRLGHSRTSTTTDFYAHPLKEIEKESADIFDNMIGNNKNGSRSGSGKEKLKVIK